MTKFEQDFIELAIKQLGTPYIWAGHGDWVWTPDGPVPMQKSAGCPKGFDCAGLVTWCALKAGGRDLTKMWNARTMWDRLPEAGPHDPFALLLYGPSTKQVEHVAIVIGVSVPQLILQAAGGGRKTTSFTEAIKASACVSLGFKGRTDALGFRSLVALKDALP